MQDHHDIPLRRLTVPPNVPCRYIPWAADRQVGGWKGRTRGREKVEAGAGRIRVACEELGRSAEDINRFENTDLSILLKPYCEAQQELHLHSTDSLCLVSS
jgi:hypothetical protein